MRKLITTVLAFAGAFSLAYAVGFSNPVIHNPALAYSTRYVLDLQNAAVNTVSATAVYSSAAFTSGSFTTGQVSTGSFLIVDNTNLLSASATNNIVVISTSGACGDAVVVTKLTIPGAFVFQACRDWNYKATTALTAASIKLALALDTDFASIASGSTIYSTSTTPGTNANAIAVTTNNTGTLTVAHATFTGGRNAEVVTVNGYAFRFGVNVASGAAASDSATNLTNAINAKAVLDGQVTATTATSSVTLQSNGAGALWNFSLKTSNTAAITVLHPTMVGGTTPSWTLGSKNITIAAHGFSLALPLLFSTGSAAAISGLTNQTTYYAIPVDANTIQLATSSAQAVLSVGTVLASSSTLTAAKSYTLAPLAWATQTGTGFKWQVSSDNSTWSDLNISSVTYSIPGSQAWDLGQINFRYLGLNVTGPTSGALNLSVTATGTYTP